jgi:GAF domain-containing protein
MTKRDALAPPVKIWPPADGRARASVLRATDAVRPPSHVTPAARLSSMSGAFGTALRALDRVTASDPAIDSLLDTVVRLVARALTVTFCKVLELQPHGASFLVRAGVGWGPSVVGRTLVSAETATLARLTLCSPRAVIVHDIQHTKIFDRASVLHEHGLTSGMSVVIPGTPHPFGVLSVHTIEQRRFTVSDAQFLSAVSIQLGASIPARGRAR